MLDLREVVDLQEVVRFTTQLMRCPRSKFTSFSPPTRICVTCCATIRHFFRLLCSKFDADIQLALALSTSVQNLKDVDDSQLRMPPTSAQSSPTKDAFSILMSPKPKATKKKNKKERWDSSLCSYFP